MSVATARGWHLYTSAVVHQSMRQSTPPSPARSPESAIAPRLPFVDALRGLALFGVFWANLLIFAGLDYMTDAQRTQLFPGAWDTLAYRLELFFVENKFMGLFSFLFGISFWLFLERARSRGAAGTPLFMRRIGWLFLFGALHGWLLWCFDILRFYALWAVLLPLFARLRLRRLLAIALSTAVLLPALAKGLAVWWTALHPTSSNLDAAALHAFATGSYAEVLRVNWLYDWYLTLEASQPAYQIAVFGRLLLGLYVARAFALGDLGAQRPLLWRILLVAGAVGLAGNAVFAGDLIAAGGFATAFVHRLATESGFLGMTLAYAAGLALLFLQPRARRLVELLSPLGRMALTWYLLQTLFGIWLCYGFAPGPHLMARIGPAAIALLAVAGYLVQVALAHVWMRHFHFGAMEWIWRSLTYGRAPRLRVGEPRSLASAA